MVCEIKVFDFCRQLDSSLFTVSVKVVKTILSCSLFNQMHANVTTDLSSQCGTTKFLTPLSPTAKIAGLEHTIREQGKIIDDKERVIDDNERVIRQLRAKLECYDEVDELKEVTKGFKLDMDRGVNLPNLLQRMTVTLVENQN